MSGPDSLGGILGSPDTASGRDLELEHARAAVRDRLFGTGGVEKLAGRYVELRRVGHGGMGVVFSAWDTELGRRVALKVLPARDGGDERERRRLQREAQAIAMLSHPNVVQVFDVGTDGDTVYVAMELVDGPTLRRACAGASVRRIVELYVQAARGLAAAHAAGLVHGDFKPHNALVGSDGRVRVVDFGLVRRTGTPSDRSDESSSRIAAAVDAEVLTRPGSVAGTPRYMAPELFEGAPRSPASDQYALCASLFDALCGRPPAEGSEPAALLEAKRRAVLPFARRVPVWLRVVLARGLRPDAADRHPDMEALIDRLRRGLGRGRRASLMFGVAVTAIGAGLVGAELARTAPPPSPCARAGDGMGARWSDARGGALVAAFTELGGPLGHGTAQRVVERLDAWADEWVATRVEVCEATREHAEQSPRLMDVRMACLDRRAQEFVRLVGLLEAGDAELVRGSIDAVDHLPSPRGCRADARLLEGVAIPDDADAAVEVAQIRTELAHVDALLWASRHAEARAAAEALRPRAEATGFDPIVAEVLHELGLALSQVEPRQAAAVLERARWHAEAGGDDALQADIELELVRVHAYEYEDTEEAERWLALASASVARLDDPARHNELREVEALLRQRQGRTEESLAIFREVAERRRQLRGEDLGYAAMRTNIGALLHMLGRSEQSREEMAAAAEIHARLVGEEHPSYAKTIGNLATVAGALGDKATEEELSRRALSILEKVFGERHRDVATAHSNLGAVLTLHGRADEAIVHLQAALRIRSEVLGPDHPETAVAHRELGRARIFLGDTEGAIASFRTAVEIAEQAHGEHPDLVEMLRGLGAAQHHAGHIDEARQTLGRAVDLSRTLLGPDHPLHVLACIDLGQAELDADRTDEALTLLRHADARREPAIHDATVLVRLDLALARAQARRGETAAARQRAEAALAFAESADVRHGSVQKLRELLETL